MVELKSQGWGFKWEKGEKGINKYWLSDNPDKPLDKVGQGQLAEVAAMGFSSVTVGSKEVQPWFASQFSPIFLINESGPAVTDFISEVSRLKILQDAITINVRNKKRALEEAKLRDSDSDRLKTFESKFDGLDRVLTLRKDLDEQLSSAEGYWERLEKIQTLAEGIDKSQKIIKLLEGVSLARTPRDNASDKFERLRWIQGKHIMMSVIALKVALFRNISGVVVPKCEVATDISKFERANSLKIKIDQEQRMVNILSKKVKVPKSFDFPKSLLQAQGLKQKIDLESSSVSSLESDLLDRLRELETVQEGLSKILVCPSCKRAVTNSHQHHPSAPAA